VVLYARSFFMAVIPGSALRSEMLGFRGKFGTIDGRAV
jgi:hypothetical protein